jgi:hypothetical protein
MSSDWPTIAEEIQPKVEKVKGVVDVVAWSGERPR